MTLSLILISSYAYSTATEANLNPSPSTQSKITGKPDKKSRGKLRRRLLDWVGLGWVDVSLGDPDSLNGVDGKKNGQDLQALLTKMKNASGNTGKGNGGSGGGGNPDLKFDENAPKGGKSGGDEVGDRGGRPPGGNSGDGSNDTQIFPVYWPVCMFFDPSVSDAQANQIIKGSIDMAGACQVNLFVVPITVKSNYSDNPDEFNPRQQASCNMGSVGIGTASTLLVNKHALAAAKMCDAKDEKGNFDPGVAGCAQLRAGGGLGKGQFESGSSSGSFGKGGMASGGIIPSTIVPNGWNAGVASHEFLGHSEMGWPNLDNPMIQDDAGLGIGSPPRAGGSNSWIPSEADKILALMEFLNLAPGPEYAAGPEGSNATGGWSQTGCAQLRKMALPNTKKVAWNPSQQAYFQIQRDPNRQWNLGDPLWGSPPPDSPPADRPPPIVNRPEPPNKEENLFFDEKAEEKKISQETQNDGRHKKKKGGSAVSSESDRLISSLRKKEATTPPEPIPKANPVAGKADKPAPESNLVFDESVKKGDSGQSADSGTGPTSSGSLGGSGGGPSNDQNLTFDEGAAKGEAPCVSEGGGSGSGSSSGGGKGRGPASISGGPSDRQLQTGSLSSSLDEGFFNSINKAERKRKRVKGETLREKVKARSTISKTRPVQTK